MQSYIRHCASVARRKALGVQAPHSNPYSTHLPVLALMARGRPVRRVLELGSGPFSTSLFLDPEIYPDLTKLVSYEDDAEWAREVKEQVGADSRLELVEVDAVRNSVPADLDSYDLVFVDDSRIRGERTVTIKSVAARRPLGTVVLVHDFEHRQYRRAARGFEHRFVFDAFTPQVGVCWNGDAVDIEWLRHVRTILRHNNHVAPTNRAWWQKTIASL